MTTKRRSLGRTALTIAASEAFGLEEAAEILPHYFTTGAVPDNVSARLLPEVVP